MISVKFSVDVNGWLGYQCRRNIAENLNRLSRAHERYRQTTDRPTDGRAIAYSERERAFTFAKKEVQLHLTRTRHGLSNEASTKFLRRS